MSSTDEAIDALITGAAEIALVLNAPARDNITRLEVFRDWIVAAFSPTHPLAGRKSVTLRDLQSFPFTMTEPSFGLRQQLDRVFAQHGFEPATFCVTNSLALVKEVASIGKQCTLLPRFAVERELDRRIAEGGHGAGVRRRPPGLLHLLAQRPITVSSGPGIYRYRGRLLPPLSPLVMSESGDPWPG